MTYPKNILYTLFFCFIPFAIGCGNNYTQKNQLVAIDTIGINFFFFDNEELFIRANDSLVFYKRMDGLRKSKNFYGIFMIPKSDTVQLSIETVFNKKRYIDTTFFIPPLIYINSIGGSMCYPVYLSEDSLKKMQQHNFGFIPLDSCKRYITLMPDSIMYRYEKGY